LIDIYIILSDLINIQGPEKVAPTAILQDGCRAPFLHFLNLNFPAPSAIFKNGDRRANFKPNF
jgi:hypothetical protein